MQVVVPPTKKHRSSEGPPLRGGGRGEDSLSAATSGAIARRRAELRRLKQKMDSASKGMPRFSTGGLVEHARAQLQGIQQQRASPSLVPRLRPTGSSLIPPSDPLKTSKLPMPQAHVDVIENRSRPSSVPNSPRPSSSPRTRLPLSESLDSKTLSRLPPPSIPTSFPPPRSNNQTIDKLPPTTTTATNVPTTKPPEPVPSKPPTVNTKERASSPVKIPVEPTPKATVSLSPVSGASPVMPTAKIARRLDPTFAEGTHPTDSDTQPSTDPPNEPISQTIPEPILKKTTDNPPPVVLKGRTETNRRPPLPKNKSTGFSRPEAITPSSKPNTRAIQPSTTKNKKEGTPISRREFLDGMREYADSPANNKDVEMVKELRKVNQEKEDAFRENARLREQIQQLQKQDRKKPEEYQLVVKVAEAEGEKAAMKWVRQKASEAPYPALPTVSFASPIRAASPNKRTVTPAIGHGLRKRVATPHPKRASEDEEEEIKYLKMATKSTPDEYFSSLATYIIRRPYAQKDPAFWSGIGVATVEEYDKTGDVGDPSTIEIAAKIKADGSLLTLTGQADVRHKKTSSKKWRVFENVDEMDKPMGCVMFIDNAANEGEYWLDEIYEEAMSTRETYCSSLISTAAALKVSMPINPAPRPESSSKANIPGHAPPQQNVASMPSPVPVPDSVEKQARQQPPMQPTGPPGPTPAEPSMMPKQASNQQPTQPEQNQEPTSQTARQTAPPKKKKKKKKLPPLEEEEPPPDLLSIMLGYIFSGVFGMIYFFIVKLPMKLISLAVSTLLFGSLLSVVWMYLADDNGAAQMNAGLGYGFNSPGIW